MPVEDGDGRRHRTGVANDLFDRQRRLDVFRPRHAVTDDGRLKRDDRPAGRSGGRDFAGDGEHRNHQAACPRIGER